MENKILKALQENIRIDTCGLQVEKNLLVFVGVPQMKPVVFCFFSFLASVALS